MAHLPSFRMDKSPAACIFSSSYMKSEMVIYCDHDHTKAPTRHPKAEPGTQNIRNPPEIQLDFGRMRWAMNEAAGIKQRFGSIRPSQKRNTNPRGNKKTPVLGRCRCLSRHPTSNGTGLYDRRNKRPFLTHLAGSRFDQNTRVRLCMRWTLVENRLQWLKMAIRLLYRTE